MLESGRMASPYRDPKSTDQKSKSFLEFAVDADRKLRMSIEPTSYMSERSESSSF